MTGAKVMVDTNILVYSFVKTAPFHAEARAVLHQLEQQGHELWISPQIVREYIATLTRPQTYTNPVSMGVVTGQADRILHSLHVADDTVLIVERLLALLEEIPAGGRQVHDANIVATMLVHGIDSLLTHNIEDFQRFQSKIMILPVVKETT